MAKISWARAAEALDNVRPSLSPAARQMLLGQAYAETKFGDELPDGSNSNNWGSVGGSGDLGSYEITDTIEGKPIKRKVARFSTPEKGAERFASVVLDTYRAGKYADAGDAWGYARALWRDGPHNPELGAPSKAPAYYGGFPPGHPYALAPAGVRQRSKLDDWYRVTAYARLTKGTASNAAKALGETLQVQVVEPPKPDEDSTDPLPATALGVVGDTLGGGGPAKKTDATAEVTRSADGKRSTGEGLVKDEDVSEEAAAPEGATSRAAKEAAAAEGATSRAAKEAAAKSDEVEDLGGDLRPTTAETKAADAARARKGSVSASSAGVPTGILIAGAGVLAWLLLSRK